MHRQGRPKQTGAFRLLSRTTPISCVLRSVISAILSCAACVDGASGCAGLAWSGLHSLTSPSYSQKPESKPDRGGRRGSILRTLSKKFDERVVLLGLQGCGKSTLCNQLNYDSPMNLTTSVSNPTKDDGEVLHFQPGPNMRMMIWDMSGSATARQEVWESQCLLSSALMFVIDAGEPEQLPVARQELLKILQMPDLSHTVPLLVWVNKMDVEGSVTETEVNDMLQLNTVCPHRQWCVQGSVFHDRARGVVRPPLLILPYGWLAACCVTLPHHASCSHHPAHCAEPRAQVAVSGLGE